MNDLLDALARAVEAAPGDVTLRLHLAGLLLDAGRRQEAIVHLAAVLAAEPANPQAGALMGAALGSPAAPPGLVANAEPSANPGAPEAPASPIAEQTEAGSKDSGAATPSSRETSPVERAFDFDWHAAESQVGDIAEPMFVSDDGPQPAVSAWDVERAELTLADVGGMTDVKERLEVSFLAPLRNPELRKMYGKSLRGGLLLYGPPGCGKTFVARAVAGEMGAKFISVGLADILDMWIGNSEKNIQELFRLARSQAPVVLFLDELDALGLKRSQTRQSAMRGTVNQLLAELDGVDSANEGVFVLAATNQPWDIDPALRRPGRLDRTLLVLPPDGPAREAILRHHLKTRPVAGIDVAKLAKLTDGCSGADLAYLCETAAEAALMDSVRTGKPRLITMDDLLTAARDIKPSTGGWFEVARNVVMFADSDGSYADLRAYMKKTRRL